MPNRVGLRTLALSIVVGLTAIGCNATCIRDSDCLGQSVCSENRCLLIAARDAGARSAPPSDGGAGGSGGDGAAGSETMPSPDAGN